MADVIPLKITAGQTARFNSTDVVINTAGFKVTSTLGLGASLEKSQATSTQIWPAAAYTEVVQYTPETGYQSLLPSAWVVPKRGSAGGSVVHGTVRFYFSDGSAVDRTNATNTAVTETRGTVAFGKDGLTITAIGLGATNTDVAGNNTTIGPWSLNGWQT